jgi:hypothetical protein
MPQAPTALSQSAQRRTSVTGAAEGTTPAAGPTINGFVTEAGGGVGTATAVAGTLTHDGWAWVSGLGWQSGGSLANATGANTAAAISVAAEMTARITTS